MVVRSVHATAQASLLTTSSSPLAAQPRPVAAPLSMPVPSSAARAPVTTPRIVEVVGRTHQMDGLAATQWDRTRCMASSSVAIAAFRGAGALLALARATREKLVARRSALLQAQMLLDSTDPELAREARPILLQHLQAHINAFGYSLRVAVEMAGGEPAEKDAPATGTIAFSDDSEDGFLTLTDEHDRVITFRTLDPGLSTLERSATVPARATYRYRMRLPAVAEAAARVQVPESHNRFPWLRHIDEGTGPRLKVETKEGELALAALVLAFHQLVGGEASLADTLVQAVEAELNKLEATEAALAKRSDDPALLQRLADSVLFTQTRTGHGMNSYYAVELMREGQLSAELLDAPIPFDELADAVKPGEAMLITGRGHACAFGRATSGETWLYDSEGIGGDPRQSCVALVNPRSASEAVRERYGVFTAVARVRTFTGRSGQLLRIPAPVSAREVAAG